MLICVRYVFVYMELLGNEWAELCAVDWNDFASKVTNQLINVIIGKSIVMLNDW